MKGTSNAKYLLFIAKDGLGNRLMSLSSALLYAIVSKRVLLVDWTLAEWTGDNEPAQFEDLFEPPPFDWSLEVHLYFESYWSRPLGDLFGKGVVTHSPDFVCSDLTLDSRRFVVLKTTQYLAPLFLNNLYLRFQNQTMLQHLQQHYFTEAFHFLCHPTQEVFSKVENFCNCCWPIDSTVIGVQIRRDFAGGDSARFVNCIREHLIPSLILAANDTTQKNKKVAFFLISDDDDMIRDVTATLQPDWPVLRYNAISSDRFSVEGVKVGLVENILLGQSDHIVTTSKSTFGYLAHSSRGKSPWVVFPNGDNSCVFINDTEPCYHGYDNKVPCLEHFIQREIC